MTQSYTALAIEAFARGLKSGGATKGDLAAVVAALARTCVLQDSTTFDSLDSRFLGADAASPQVLLQVPLSVAAEIHAESLSLQRHKMNNEAAGRVFHLGKDAAAATKESLGEDHYRESLQLKRRGDCARHFVQSGAKGWKPKNTRSVDVQGAADNESNHVEATDSLTLTDRGVMLAVASADHHKPELPLDVVPGPPSLPAVASAAEVHGTATYTAASVVRPMVESQGSEFEGIQSKREVKEVEIEVGLFLFRDRGLGTCKVVRDDRLHCLERCRGWRVNDLEDGRDSGRGIHLPHDVLLRKIHEGHFRLGTAVDSSGLTLAVAAVRDGRG